MSEREQEISAAMDLIWGMCEKYDMGIIAKQDKSGTYRVGVFDAKTGNEYFLARQPCPNSDNK